MSNLYQVRTSKEASDASLEYIKSKGFPIIGTNAKTGNKNPKSISTGWALTQETLQGKFVYPIISADKLEGWPIEIIEEYMTLYPYEVEEYDSTWFPQEEF